MDFLPTVMIISVVVIFIIGFMYVCCRNLNDNMCAETAAITSQVHPTPTLSGHYPTAPIYQQPIAIYPVQYPIVQPNIYYVHPNTLNYHIFSIRGSKKIYSLCNSDSY